MKEVWIIGCGGSDADGIGFLKVFGEKEKVAEIMFNEVQKAKEYDGLHWSDGTESIDEIEERPNGSLYAYACFPDYHIDWEAKPLCDIETIQ